MGLKEKLQADLTDAIRARDEVKSGTVRMLLSAITNEEVHLIQINRKTFKADNLKKILEDNDIKKIFQLVGFPPSRFNTAPTNLFTFWLDEYAPWLASCITDNPIPAIPRPATNHNRSVNQILSV